MLDINMAWNNKINSKEIQIFAITLEVNVQIFLVLPIQVMSPSPLTLPNNEFFLPKLGEALTVIADAPDYLNVPTRICFEYFQVGFSWVFFIHIHYFIYQSMTCWIVFIPSPNTSLLIFLSSTNVNGTACGLISKTKNNKSQGWEATFSKVLYFCLM